MSKGPQTVIVAEDEALTRILAVEVLEAAGFIVIEVEHAAGALAVLDAQGEEVSLLFTDIHMPGEMDGLALAHHVHGCWPRVALLITSGNVSPSMEELPTGSRFLPKPYEVAHLEAHVRMLVA